MRSQLFSLFLACGVTGLSVNGGTLQGTVRAQPPSGPGFDDQGAGAGAYGSRKFKFVERIDYSHLTDFVVYLDGPAPLHAIRTPGATGKVVQKAATFVPHVLPIQKGTTVEWPNLDEIFHNVFSYSDAKSFDLGLYKQPAVKTVLFEKPGRVDVFCSIHKSMNCIILVLDTPHFSSVDAHGRFEISGIPAGTYRFKAWHERLPPEVREITIPETGTVRSDFILKVNSLPKY